MTQSDFLKKSLRCKKSQLVVFKSLLVLALGVGTLSYDLNRDLTPLVKPYVAERGSVAVWIEGRIWNP